MILMVLFPIYSGGGKSTTMGLIERFYDPLEGSISLDGTNIKDLNLAHYRNLMGYGKRTVYSLNLTHFDPLHYFC